MVIQQGVKECILQKDSATNLDLKKVMAIMERCSIVVTQVKASHFSLENINQDLDRLLGQNVTARSEFELKAGLKGVASLIKYLDLLSQDDNHGSYTLFQYDLSAFMKLDASAVSALNLFPGPKDGKKNTNLFGLYIPPSNFRLNHCKTAQGSRLLAQWIKQPLMNASEIRMLSILI